MCWGRDSVEAMLEKMLVSASEPTGNSEYMGTVNHIKMNRKIFVNNQLYNL